MTDLVIGEGTQVTLHFALKLDSGEVVDSNFEDDPAIFSIGDGNLLPGFERALFGMTAGDSATFEIPPEDAFGFPNPNNIQEVERENFGGEFELENGLVVSFADASGAETPGIVREFDEEKVVIDFNHPLAGETITFEVNILSVSPVVTH